MLSRLLWPPQHADPIFCTLRTRKACEMYVGGHPTRTHRVLNECLVDRGASPAMVVMECFVDGVHLTTVQVMGVEGGKRGERRRAWERIQGMGGHAAPGARTGGLSVWERVWTVHCLAQFLLRCADPRRSPPSHRHCDSRPMA